MDTSFWPLCLAVTAWIAVGVLACVVKHLEDSLAKEKIKLSMLDTAVSMRGDLLVKKNDELGAILKDTRALVDAHNRRDDAGAKAVGLALADRIDALSARMDAVELACGLREKPKTMGGHGE